MRIQQLAKENECVNKEVRAEVDARRRRAELEDSAFHNLLQTDGDLGQETRRVRSTLHLFRVIKRA